MAAKDAGALVLHAEKDSQHVSESGRPLPQRDRGDVGVELQPTDPDIQVEAEGDCAIAPVRFNLAEVELPPLRLHLSTARSCCRALVRLSTGEPATSQLSVSGFKLRHP